MQEISGENGEINFPARLGSWGCQGLGCPDPQDLGISDIFSPFPSLLY